MRVDYAVEAELEENFFRLRRDVSDLPFFNQLRAASRHTRRQPVPADKFASKVANLGDNGTADGGELVIGEADFQRTIFALERRDEDRGIKSFCGVV